MEALEDFFVEIEFASDLDVGELVILLGSCGLGRGAGCTALKVRKVPGNFHSGVFDSDTG